jgi:hypothetical protein
MRIDAKNIAELLIETIAQSASVLADNIARRLSGNSRRYRSILARCRATTESGAQCKRRPVSGSDYCHQHRGSAKSDGRLFVVLGARDKAAKATSEFTRMTRTAAVRATTRLTALGPTLRAEALPREGVLGLRQVARRAAQTLRMQNRWVISGIALALVVAASIAILKVANVDINSLNGFSGQIIPRNALATGRDSEPPNGQEAQDSNPTELFTGAVAFVPGTDFRGAFISGVEHLSGNSTMLEIFVPAGVEGNYHAIVTASEGSEFQCVILHHYTDRLYCIGARLQEGSQVNVRIFRIDEVQGSSSLVFETDYTTGDFVPLPQPTQPAIVPYGGGFTWPDRFDDIERQREQESTKFLWPLSTVSGVAALWLMIRVRRALRQTKRLIGRGMPHPIA